MTVKQLLVRLMDMSMDVEVVILNREYWTSESGTVGCEESEKKIEEVFDFQTRVALSPES
jgi:hypothetical protein